MLSFDVIIKLINTICVAVTAYGVIKTMRHTYKILINEQNWREKEYKSNESWRKKEHDNNNEWRIEEQKNNNKWKTREQHFTMLKWACDLFASDNIYKAKSGIGIVENILYDSLSEHDIKMTIEILKPMMEYHKIFLDLKEKELLKK